MSVHTPIHLEELKIFLKNYPFDNIQEFRCIEDGVTNTIYFIRANNKPYVLTIFENTSAEELPFYIALTRYLNQQDILCPDTISQRDGTTIAYLHGKPAMI